MSANLLTVIKSIKNLLTYFIEALIAGAFFWFVAWPLILGPALIDTWRQILWGIPLIGLLLFVCGISTVVRNLIRDFNKIFESKDVKAAVLDYKATEERLRQARLDYSNCVNRTGPEDLAERLGIMMEAGRHAYNQTQRLRVLMEIKLRSSYWRNHVSSEYGVYDFQLTDRAEELCDEFVAPEDGPYLMIDPVRWEERTAHDEGQDQPGPLRLWNKQERAAFICRWQRLFPEKPVCIKLSGISRIHRLGVGTEVYGGELSDPIYTVNELLAATEEEIEYDPGKETFIC